MPTLGTVPVKLKRAKLSKWEFLFHSPTVTCWYSRLPSRGEDWRGRTSSTTGEGGNRKRQLSLGVEVGAVESTVREKAGEIPY